MKIRKSNKIIKLLKKRSKKYKRANTLSINLKLLQAQSIFFDILKAVKLKSILQS